MSQVDNTAIFGSARPAMALNSGNPAAPNVVQPAQQEGALRARSNAFKDGVDVSLERLFPAAGPIVFSLPIAPGAVTRWQEVAVSVGASRLPAKIRPLLSRYDRAGKVVDVASIQIELPARAMAAQKMVVSIRWKGATSTPETPTRGFAADSKASPETAKVADRYIVKTQLGYSLVEENVRALTLFNAVEPNVMAVYPDGYLAATGVLNPYFTAASSLSSDLTAMSFLKDAVPTFAASALVDLPYAVHPAAAGPTKDQYEAWLYDRCATLLMFHAFNSAPALLRHANRACGFYARTIQLEGPNRGISDVKSSPDAKYSHLKGLYAYYAMTGDEAALAAGRAMADLWYNEEYFVAPYAAGRIRGADKMWTERLLAASLEGLYYGYLLTGEVKYFERLGQLLESAYRHITTQDQAKLNAITMLGGPGYPAFPAQNCFVHNAEQHTEGDGKTPWCSPWMSTMLVDVLTRYQREMNDSRALEIMLRLGRYLRDTGTHYFADKPLRDTFLQPSTCFLSLKNPEEARMLVPSYGAGVRVDGTLARNIEWEDSEHCPDTAALSAAALLGLSQLGEDPAAQKRLAGKFPNERASLEALHSELAYCSKRTLENYSRPKRDPRTWKSENLVEGYNEGNRDAQAKWIEKNKIGFPTHPTSPYRKLGWWFNVALLEFGFLDAAGVKLQNLKVGIVQPEGCVK